MSIQRLPRRLRPIIRLPQLARRGGAPPPTPETDVGPVLVLSGGARMGAVQVGILRALAETGFRPRAVIGTSTGAFNAAHIAFHPHDEDCAQLRAVWESLRFHRIFNRNRFRMAYNAIVRGDHFYSNGELRGLLHRHIQPDDFGATAMPLYVVATDLGTGEKHVFTAGSVQRAVLASAAIPGFFPPVEIGGKLYVDGAVTANLDLDTAAALGARHIVAVDVSASVAPEQPRTIMAVISRTLEIIMRERTFLALDRLEPRARITLLRPDPLTMHRLGGIASMNDLLDEADRVGRDLVARALDSQGCLAHGLVSTAPVGPLPGLAPVGLGSHLTPNPLP